jgi:hypothetical protein
MPAGNRFELLVLQMQRDDRIAGRNVRALAKHDLAPRASQRYPENAAPLGVELFHFLIAPHARCDRRVPGWIPPALPWRR